MLVSAPVIVSESPATMGVVEMLVAVKKLCLQLRWLLLWGMAMTMSENVFVTESPAAAPRPRAN